MRLLHNLMLDLFMSIFRLLASLAEQTRNGTLPAEAPATGCALGNDASRAAGSTYRCNRACQNR